MLPFAKPVKPSSLRGKFATLDDALNISLFNSFDPTAEDEVQSVTYSARVGDFAVDHGLLLAEGRCFSQKFNEETVPSDLTLMTNAATGLLIENLFASCLELGKTVDATLELDN